MEYREKIDAKAPVPADVGMLVHQRDHLRFFICTDLKETELVCGIEIFISTFQIAQ